MHPRESRSEGGLRAYVGALRLDVRYAWRAVRRMPVFSSVIVASLAIVIGANAALFGVVDVMFLQRLPVSQPEQLATPMQDGQRIEVQYAGFRDLRGIAGVPRLAAYRHEGADVAAGSDRTSLWVTMVTHEYFDVLGIAPALGRAIIAADERDGAPVVVVSDRYWKLHMNGRPDVLGSTIRLSGTPFTVIGVLPPVFAGMHFAHRTDLYAPITVSPAGYADFPAATVNMIARLDPGRATVAQAAALRLALERCCAQRIPPGDSRPANLHVVPVPDIPSGDRGKPFTSTPGRTPPLTFADASHGLVWSTDFRVRYQDVIMVVAAGLLLLLIVACANIGTLLVSRAESRERELAIRLSLGATRGRIARQLFIEALELAILGAGLGVLVSVGATSLLVHALPTSASGLGATFSRWPNPAMLGLTAGLALLCTIVVSIWPARRATRVSLLGELTGARRIIAGGWTADRLLIVVQFALAIVLVSSASLFVSTVRNLTRSEGGYNSRHVVLARATLEECQVIVISAMEACNEAVARAMNDRLYDRVRERAAALPGVSHVGLALNAPLAQDAFLPRTLRVDDAPSLEFRARITMVGGEFFEASGINLLAGRAFQPSDSPSSEHVVVISQALARRRFGGRSPLGHTLVEGSGARAVAFRVIGVVGDAKYDRMKDLHAVNLRATDDEVMYGPLGQVTQPLLRSALTMVVRTAADPATVLPALRLLDAEHPAMRFTSLQTIGEVLDDATVRERFAADLASLFGVIALSLSAIGVFGVLSYNVARRTREIGVRMALGARPADALRLVFAQTGLMCAAGVVLGLPIAVAASWASRSLLYGVPFVNTGVLVGAPVLLAVVAAAATVVPGRRATTVDPLAALRSE